MNLFYFIFFIIFRANKSVNLKAISPLINKKNETLKLKFVSYGQDINFNNLYSRNFHPSQNELNPLYNNPKNDIFLIKSFPKKEKMKYKPKVYIFRVNFFYLFYRKKENKLKMLKIIILNMILFLRKLLMLLYILLIPVNLFKKKMNYPQ